MPSSRAAAIEALDDAVHFRVPWFRPNIGQVVDLYARHNIPSDELFGVIVGRLGLSIPNFFGCWLRSRDEGFAIKVDHNLVRHKIPAVGVY